MATNLDGKSNESLEDQAWFAFEQADKLCEAAHGCRDYHRLWSLVRLVDLQGVPPRGGSFLRGALPGCARVSGKVRILVAGAADTGVPTMVHDAARGAGLKPTICVVDRCRTPLAQIDRLANLSGMPVKTQKGTLQELDAQELDVIITHNVMRFIDNTARLKVFRGFANALRPGGRLLSIETLEAASGERGQHEVERRVSRFNAKLEQTGFSAVQKQALADAAHSFWTRKRFGTSYPEAECRQDLQAAGFNVHSVARKSDEHATSPRIGDGAGKPPRQYAYVIAESVAQSPNTA